MAKLDAFTRAYVEAALWSTNDESDEQGGEPLDANYGPGDISPETMELIVEDCADFQKRFGQLIEDDDSPRIEKEGRWELAGYHFWLTREGHGAGFWDGDWPKHGDELTEASKSYGPFELYVGDDGQIYGPPPDQYRHPPEWLAKRHPSRGRGGRPEEHVTREAAGRPHPGCIDRRRLGEMMSPWGGDTGSGVPVYAVGSYYFGGHAYPDRAMVEKAIAEVERMIPMAKQGMHGWTAKDAKDLSTIARGLKCYLTLDYPTTSRGRRSEEPQRVADFSTLPEIIEHAGTMDGATHVLVAGKNTRLYYPTGRYWPNGSPQYEEGKVWQQAGYWHSQSPGERKALSAGLPNGAQSIASYLAGSGRRAVVSEALTVRDRPRVPTPPKSFRSPGGRSFTTGAVQRTLPHYDGDPHWSDMWPILHQGQPAGKLFRSASYGPDKPWSATIRELYWKHASGAAGIGYDVAAFATPQEALEAWARSADEILDWHEGKKRGGHGPSRQRTSRRRR